MPAVVGLTPVQPRLGSSASALGSLVRQRWAQQKLATQATNRLHQLLAATWPEVLDSFDLMAQLLPHSPGPRFFLQPNPDLPRSQARTWAKLQTLAFDTVGITDPTYEAAIQRIAQERLEALQKRDALEGALSQLVQDHPYGPILLAFPALGVIAAATLISAIVDVGRFPTVWAFRKALGVSAVDVSSGQATPRGKMYKGGNKDTKRVLFQAVMPAASSRTKPTPWGDYYRKHKSMGKPGMKAMAAGMGKLAKIIYICLKKGEEYRYETRKAQETA